MRSSTLMKVSALIFGIGLTSGCSSSTSPTEGAAMIRGQERDLVGILATGPVDWISTGVQGAIDHRRNCISAPTNGGWIASVLRSWHHVAAQEFLGHESPASVNVCLSIYESASDAQRALDQVKQEIDGASGSPGAPPSSSPMFIGLPYIPGAIGQFIDFGTFGHQSIYFSIGNVTAWVDTMCAANGGGTCMTGISTANRIFHSLSSQSGN